MIPGLVDLHFHGCVGSDISDHDLEGIRKMAAYELKSGITAICPATMTLSEEILSDALSTAKQYVSETAEADRDDSVLTGSIWKVLSFLRQRREHRTRIIL